LLKKNLQKPKKDDTNSYGSIKYWIANSGTENYHKNLNQQVFEDYFRSKILKS